MIKIFKRKGSDNYYIRHHVPTDSRKSFGKSEVIKSLRTSNLSIAKSKAPEELAKIILTIEASQISNTQTRRYFEPDNEQMEKAARIYYASQVQSDLDERIHDPEIQKELYHKDRYRAYVKQLKTELAMGKSDAVDNEYWEEIFQFQFTNNSTKRIYFHGMLLRAELEAAMRYVDHDKGKMGGKPKDPLLKGLVDVDTFLAKNSENTKCEQHLIELYPEYVLHVSGSISQHTLNDRRKAVALFSQFVGLNTHPSKIKKEDARNWRNALREWPAKAAQQSVFKGLDFNAIIKANKHVNAKIIGKRTLAKYMSHLSSYFTWMETDDYINKNIFDGLAPKVIYEEESRLPLSDNQLTMFFTSPLFLGCLRAC